MSVYDEYTPPETSGLYIKLRDGDELILRIGSEPAVFADVYKGDKETTVRTQYAWVVYDYNTGTARILTAGISVFNQILELARDPEWGDPFTEKYFLKVKRTGEKLNTKYKVTPSPKKAPFDKEQQAAIDEVKLLDELAKSQNRHSIAWLKDVVKGRKPDPSSVSIDDIAKQHVDEAMDDSPRTNPSADDPVDLSEIPF